MAAETYLDIRRKSQLRREIIGEIGRRHLAGTAFTEDKPFTPEDTEAVLQGYLEAAPYTDQHLYPQFWDHSIGTGFAAEIIADIVNDSSFPSQMARALNTAHDAGSLDRPDLYGRKNLADEDLALRAQVRPELDNNLHPVWRVLGRGVPVESLKDLTLAQIISDVADNRMKFNIYGNLIPLETLDAQARQQPTRYANSLVPSTRRGLKALSEGVQEKSIRLFHEEVEYLRAHYGVDIEDVRQRVLEKMNEPVVQSWLWAVKEAQESLDPRVDEKLGRPPIQIVALDMGKVLVEDADPPLWQKLGTLFNRDPQAVEKAVGSLGDLAMPGSISLPEYTHQLRELLGLTLTHQEIMSAFNQPSIYHPVAGMQELVKQLSQNPGIKLYVLSDCHEIIAKPNTEALAPLYPPFRAENIFFSSIIKASKRVGGLAFAELLKLLGNPDPSSVLFIDDNRGYTTKARAGFGIRVLTFLDNLSSGRTAAARIQEELARGGVLTT